MTAAFGLAVGIYSGAELLGVDAAATSWRMKVGKKDAAEEAALPGEGQGGPGEGGEGGAGLSGGSAGLNSLFSTDQFEAAPVKTAGSSVELAGAGGTTKGNIEEDPKSKKVVDQLHTALEGARYAPLLGSSGSGRGGGGSSSGG